MIKKKLFGLLGVALIPALLAGCGSSKSSSSSSKKTEVKITWRYSGDNDITSRFLKKKFIPSFEKSHPNIKVVLSPITASEGDYYSKVALSMQSSKTAPDVIAEDQLMVSSDANAGYLTKLNKYIKNWDQWGEYIDNLKSGGKGSDGNYYAIPGTSDSRGIWYNKDVFKKAGLPTNWQPKNWQDILTAAEKIKKAEPKVIPLSLSVAKSAGESTSMQTFEMLNYGTDTPLYNSKTKKWSVSSKGVKDTLNFINTVYNTKKLGPDLSIAINSNYGSVISQDKFVHDELGMFVDGFWNTASWKAGGPVPVKNMTKRFGFAAMPTQNGQKPGSLTMSGGWTWAMPAKGTHKSAAWEVIKALGSKDNQAERATIEGNLTVRKDSAQVKSYKDQPFIAQATKFLDHAYFRPANDNYNSVSIQIQDAVEAVATAQKTPKQATASFAKAVTKIVGKKNIAK